VGAEVQRIRAAFQAASMELSAALHAMSEVDLSDLGTPTSDPAVTTGLSDLRTSLERQQATADACVLATARHLGGPDTTAEASAPGDV
jgi:hypothetical protein